MSKQRKPILFLPVWLLAVLSFILIFITACRGVLRESLIASIIFIPCLIVIIIVLRRRKKPLLSDQQLHTLQIILHILSLALTVVIAIFGAVEISWDWGALIKTASSLTLDHRNVLPDYFLRYPNNQFWLSFLTVFFTSCKTFFRINTESGFQIASVVLSIIFVRLSYIFIFLNNQKIFGTRRARFIDIILLFFIPMYLYAPFAYTDTSTLLLISLLIYVYLHFKSTPVDLKSKSFWQFVLLFSLITALLYHIKVLTLIVPLAMFSAEIINHRSAIKDTIIKYTSITVSAVAIAVILSLPLASITKLDLSQSDLYRFPPTHWIMMSFNNNGGYNQADVIYTSDIPTYAERQVATRAKLKERLADRGFFGTLGYILNIKLYRQWGDSLMLSDDMFSRMAYYPDSFIEQFFGIKQFGNNAQYHWICLILSWSYYLLFILGWLLSLIESRKLKHLHFSQVAILGFFIFFLIWECASRYIFAFTPAFIICSAFGWFYLSDSLSHSTSTKTGQWSLPITPSKISARFTRSKKRSDTKK